ncbi:MAG: hypothetical protein ACJ8HI_22545 [Massilia sp.]
MMNLKLTTTFALLTLAGCAGTPAGPALKSGSYPLKPLQTVEIGGGATVRYDAFSDSRCPKGAQCIWAGKVTYSFTLMSGTANEAFALDYEGQTVAAKSLPVRFGISFAGVKDVPVEQHAVVLEVTLAK